MTLSRTSPQRTINHCALERARWLSGQVRSRAQQDELDDALFTRCPNTRTVLAPRKPNEWPSGAVICACSAYMWPPVGEQDNDFVYRDGIPDPWATEDEAQSAG